MYHVEREHAAYANAQHRNASNAPDIIDLEISAALNAFQKDALRERNRQKTHPEHEELIPQYTEVLRDQDSDDYAGTEIELKPADYSGHAATSSVESEELARALNQYSSEEYAREIDETSPAVPPAAPQPQNAAYAAENELNRFWAQPHQPQTEQTFYQQQAHQPPSPQWQAPLQPANAVSSAPPPVPNQADTIQAYVESNQSISAPYHQQPTSQTPHNGAHQNYQLPQAEQFYNPPAAANGYQNLHAQPGQNEFHQTHGYEQPPVPSQPSPYVATPTEQYPPHYQSSPHRPEGLPPLPANYADAIDQQQSAGHLGEAPTYRPAIVEAVPSHKVPARGNALSSPPVAPAQIGAVVRPAGQQSRSRSKDNATSEANRQLEAYFGRRPLWVYLSIIMGLAFIFHPGRFHPLYGMELSLDGPLFAGATLILLGLFRAFSSTYKATDREIDELSIDYLNAMEANALEQMGANDSKNLAMAPIVLSGYPDLEKTGGAFWSSKCGKDNILRHTPKALTILLFREQDVVAYEGAMDITTGTCVYEKVSEFFYQDITSIGVNRQSIQRKILDWSRFVALLMPWENSFIDRINGMMSDKDTLNNNHRHSRDIFYMGLTNGDNIVSVLRDGRFSGDTAEEELPTGLDNSIMLRIRQLIRQKKNEQRPL